jgi:hypothetical protein
LYPTKSWIDSGVESHSGRQSIRRRLETVGEVYDLLFQQAGDQRMEALEIGVALS